MISVVFTDYQWRRSGPALVFDVTGRSPLAEDTDVRAEIVSAGRIVTVRMVQLEIEWSDGGKTYQPFGWLAAAEVLTVGFELPADPPEPTLVPCCVSVQVLRGIRWSRSRLMPLR